jgi:hypothetical protein
MAEPAKTPKVKGPTGKKLPKWAIPVGAAGVVLVVLVLKKKSSATASNATEPGTEGLSNQSFIPVTGENVAGVGASGAGLSGVGGETGNNEALLAEIIKGDKEDRTTQEQQNKEFLGQLLANLGTGGGAPSTPAVSGGVTVPPPETQPTPTPTPTPPPPIKAPPPAPVPMHVVRCGNGCEGHEYPKGKNGKGAKVTECQVKNSKKQCVWP